MTKASLDFNAFFEVTPPGGTTVAGAPAIFVERPGMRAQLIKNVAITIGQHLLEARSILLRSKHKKLASLLEAVIPESVALTTRSGDLGEIIATEYARANTKYSIPINKLQWKSDRKMPMHGNDLIGIDKTFSPPRFLKGETKSAESMRPSTITKAAASLDLNGGRPNPSTVGFIIQRLLAMKRDDEALAFAVALTKQLKPSRIEHQIFALCGADPAENLKAAPVPIRNGIARTTVATVVNDHQAFIKASFKAAYGK